MRYGSCRAGRGRLLAAFGLGCVVLACAPAPGGEDDARDDTGTDAREDTGADTREDAGAETLDADTSDDGTTLEDGTDEAEAGREASLPIGYYRVDTVPAGGSAQAATVVAWTNLAYLDWGYDARAFDHEPGTDMAPVVENMRGMLQRVTEAGLDVAMDVSYGTAWGPRLTRQTILETARPYWDRVKFIVLGDELSLSLEEATGALDEFRAAMTALGLGSRPVGVVLTPGYVLSSPAMLGASWDFLAIEAYTPSCACGSCGAGTVEDEVRAVVEQVAQQESIIPGSIDLVIIMQGYDRNGAFANLDALAAVNRATYFDIVRGNDRYKGIFIFAWQREGTTCAENPYPEHGHGSSGLPQLQAVHQEIWRDLTAP